MRIDRRFAENAFEKYINGYDLTAAMIRLKAEHTYRVSALCEEIAKSLKLSPKDRDVAWLIGLLHDVGRFEQQKRFGTFNDAASIDHAKYGAELLFHTGMAGNEKSEKAGGKEEGRLNIRDFLEDDSEDKLLWTAVYYHSAYRLPEDMDERTKMFCNILRDADKIDILKVNVEFPLEEIYNVSHDELYTAEVTGEVMESFFQGKAVLRSLKKTAVDNIVGHISLVYELVYPRSREIVREQGYLDRLMHFQSENPRTAEQFGQIREKIYGDRSFS